MPEFKDPIRLALEKRAAEKAQRSTQKTIDLNAIPTTDATARMLANLIKINPSLKDAILARADEMDKSEDKAFKNAILKNLED